MTPRTLLEKVWTEHVVAAVPDQPMDVLYVDLHLLHEVTSPQAFDSLRAQGRLVRRPDLTLATEDHNVPTFGIGLPVEDPDSRLQMTTLRRNCTEFGVPYHPMGDPGQGIVHVIGPEQGFSQPGMTIVCGDSHTSTHGALGALALGIGSSEVEHVLATQTIALPRPAALAVEVDGTLGADTSAKDLALAVIRALGPNGAAGQVIEYRGPAVEELSIEGRMTLCNMSIEAGARAGMVAPDEATLAYLDGRPHAPRGRDWDDAVRYWASLRTDPDAAFDRTVRLDADTITASVSWGTNPSQVVAIDGVVPDPDSFAGERERRGAVEALRYMGLTAGTPIRDIEVDTVFIGSCTNGRIEDLRAAADVLRGRRIAEGMRALAVPGSMRVRRQAEREGLDEVFRRAGFEWRTAGCSMCTGMNPDRLGPGQRSASTTNRNFEGRQGAGGRTHLVSPAVAAATAVAGTLAAPADLG
ncbi:3-isopropylmalate dehydratase large subunit [Rhodococcus sp. NPDC058505]|uniref:3-isopropylmalate dehydratase large subunit n=1 Tax=Rhodococcus sp. NPDC058505 TaxID=3346531 RepID=UPI0036494904